MIYYFSGTGNSEWVAGELARLTGDEAHAIAPLADKAGGIAIAAPARVGIVFPVYAWGAPAIVERFCRSITIADGAYAYVVCTCGDEAGRAVKRLQKWFPIKAHGRSPCRTTISSASRWMIRRLSGGKSPPRAADLRRLRTRSLQTRAATMCRKALRRAENRARSSCVQRLCAAHKPFFCNG